MTLPAPEPRRIAAEIGHVLFMDLVGFSLLPMEEQSRRIQELRAVVRGTPEFIRADANHELIALDTGDGMALVFFRDPLSPVQCAAEVTYATRTHPGLRLRMGIHSGPVSRVPDINGKENVTGSGINTAQRVMDCGDAGHILLSFSSADVLREFETWANGLQELGEAEAKHGIRLRLYNLVLNEIGNPARPSRLQTDSHPISSTDIGLNPPSPPPVRQEQGETKFSPVPASPLPPPPSSNREGARPTVALLYKRHDAASERLLTHLENALKEHGYSVFIDRHLRVGEEWAREIATQIKNVAAVVPLLSASAVGSEMLEWEIETAHAAAQTQGGRPRLLPVRVAYEGPLPETLASILAPLQYTLWQSEADDARVVEEILAALAGPSKKATPLKRESVGGAVPLDSAYYNVRPTDAEFGEAIARQDSIVLLKGGRQMGKTSLLARGLQQARERTAKVVFTDFQALSAEHFASADALYRAFADAIADQLDFDTLPEDAWNANRAANTNFERYLRREVLGTFAGPLVWGLDEVDRLFTVPFGSEVFGLFRSWHNRRSLDPTGPWSRLTLAIAYATEAHLFITDLNQSPFNVGTRLTLSDFDVPQVAELNRRYGEPLRGRTEVESFHALIGGQPYLSRRGLDEMANRGVDLTRFAARATQEDGPYGDHLRRLLVSLSQDTELLEAVRSVLRGNATLTPEVFYRLRGAGILAGEGVTDARPRCRLYADYLSRHLL